MMLRQYVLKKDMRHHTFVSSNHGIFVFFLLFSFSYGEYHLLYYCYYYHCHQYHKKQNEQIQDLYTQLHFQYIFWNVHLFQRCTSCKSHISNVNNTPRKMYVFQTCTSKENSISNFHKGCILWQMYFIICNDSHV